MWKKSFVLAGCLCARGFALSNCDLRKAPIGVDHASFSRVVVYDQREMIVNEKEKPNWIGYEHSVGGPDWNINTVTLKPVGDEIAKVLANQPGFTQSTASYVGIPTADLIKGYIVENKVKSFLAIRIRELAVDKIFDARMTYSLAFEAYDSTGALRDTFALNGIRILPHGDFEEILPKVLGWELGRGVRGVSKQPKPDSSSARTIDSLAPVDNGTRNIAAYSGGWKTYMTVLYVTSMVTGALSLGLALFLAKK